MATPGNISASTSARADLLRRLNRPTEAAAAYREAIEQAATDAERSYLARRPAETKTRGSATSGVPGAKS